MSFENPKIPDPEKAENGHEETGRREPGKLSPEEEEVLRKIIEEKRKELEDTK